MKDMSQEKRMYILVPYQLTGIQKGIQALHAVVEYAAEFQTDEAFRLYTDWQKNWKTVIILNGGTSNDGEKGIYGFEPMKGSMNDAIDFLKKYEIKHSVFREPDLNNMVTGIALIGTAKMFDREIPTYSQWQIDTESKTSEELVFSGHDFNYYCQTENITKEEAITKEFLNSYRLA